MTRAVDLAVDLVDAVNPAFGGAPRLIFDGCALLLTVTAVGLGGGGLYGLALWWRWAC